MAASSRGCSVPVYCMSLVRLGRIPALGELNKGARCSLLARSGSAPSYDPSRLDSVLICARRLRPMSGRLDSRRGRLAPRPIESVARELACPCSGYNLAIKSANSSASSRFISDEFGAGCNLVGPLRDIAAAASSLPVPPAATC